MMIDNLTFDGCDNWPSWLCYIGGDDDGPHLHDLIQQLVCFLQVHLGKNSMAPPPTLLITRSLIQYFLNTANTSKTSKHQQLKQQQLKTNKIETSITPIKTREMRRIVGYIQWSLINSFQYWFHHDEVSFLIWSGRMVSHQHIGLTSSLQHSGVRHSLCHDVSPDPVHLQTHW